MFFLLYFLKYIFINSIFNYIIVKLKYGIYQKKTSFICFFINFIFQIYNYKSLIIILKKLDFVFLNQYLIPLNDLCLNNKNLFFKFNSHKNSNF